LHVSGGLAMSIGPVQGVGQVFDGPSANANMRSRQALPGSASHPAPGRSSQPDVATASKRETVGAGRPSESAELPQDEVQVLRDSQVQDLIVIKYLNQASGTLILQVPSAQVLNVDRGIQQELEQQAKVRDSAGETAVEHKGEEPHGH
jgi:hypothetical protein